MFFNKKYKLYSDEKLMTHIVSKNEKAFEELYERYSKKMIYYFYQKLNFDTPKANDLVHDLFLKLIENPAAFNTKKKFSSWIYSLANNMCKNEYKRMNIRRVELPPHSLVEEESTEQSPKFKHFSKSLNAELNKLKEEHQTTFILKHKENFTIKEISKIMNCSEGTVKSRLYNTTKKLAKELSIFNK